MIKNFKNAISGECGGPSVETIIGIAVALIMGVALIAFGRAVVSWIAKSKQQVNNMEVGNLTSTTSYT